MNVKTEKQQRKINQSKDCSQVELSYVSISKVGGNPTEQRVWKKEKWKIQEVKLGKSSNCAT